MLVGPLITGPLLRAVGTLDSMYEGCRNYLNIFFYGIAGFFFYNIFAGILRGLGDSFSALLYLIITASLNIVLDLAFVEEMGVAGVALATVIAQFISALLCLRKILSLKSVFRLRRSDLRPDKAHIGRIVSLGVPSGLTQAIFSCAMIVVQRLINSFEDEMFVACNVMVMRVDGYAMLPNFSFGQAMSTFAGQNIGARRLDRLRDGTRQGLWLSVGTSLVLTPAVLLAGPMLMRLFTPEQALIDLSMQMVYRHVGDSGAAGRHARRGGHGHAHVDRPLHGGAAAPAAGLCAGGLGQERGSVGSDPREDGFRLSAVQLAAGYAHQHRGVQAGPLEAEAAEGSGVRESAGRMGTPSRRFLHFAIFPLEILPRMLYNTSRMPVCWNGRRGGLKIRCQRWRVGSSPTTGTMKET